MSLRVWALAVLAALGCDVSRRVFSCESAAQCVLGAQAGRCEATGHCSFPDRACPGGASYGEHAPPALAGRCVERSRCGDGVIGRGEECDDGNADEDDGCTSRCLPCGPAQGEVRFVWKQTGSCYTRHEERLDWIAAHDACASRGAHLVTLTSVYEQRAVDAGLLAGATAAYWLGLSDGKVEGTFAWVTGEPVLVDRWKPGQPDDDGGRQDCTARLPRPASPLDDLSWEDEDCRRPLGFLCERGPWILREQTGHAYRVLPRLLAHAQAKEECRKAGAHLATVSDEGEQTFLAVSFSGANWLGADDRKKEGTFVWVTGEPFSYRAFAATEPDNYLGGHHCLLIAEDRRWHDRPCSEPYPALCEID